ncbi:uncharacterized protein N7482_004313 [Penicillium canariense]|uniref:Uncharacterized protein n=1 Tax=Penicillium canariense TaxID=189055 RepID=A0A9W9I651_9EURO|nr:uncharacterized protein N7482_004313 [Penicillium canariense]KAJ5168719.1 hypothetical protein N7482_004313 [Penicillium canariense]
MALTLPTSHLATMSYSQFHITEESWGHHYRVVTTDGAGSTHHFFLENSPFDRSRPDFRMHEGPDANGPVVGLSCYRRFSQDCRVVLVENEEDAEKSEWVTLAKKGHISPAYSFQAPLHGEMGTFWWKKTRSMGTHATPLGNMKLVDEKSDAVLAVFSSDSYALVPGRLDMCGEYGETFDRMALLTGVSVREKQRRAQGRPMRHGMDYTFTAGVAGGGMSGGC